VTLYTLTFNCPPFVAETELGILEKITKTKLEMKSKRNVSNGLQNLILSCLEKDIDKRITMSELRKNEWVNEGFMCSLDSKGKFLLFGISYLILEAHFISHITKDDVEAKKFPVYAVLFVKRLGKLWRKKFEERRQSGILDKELPSFSENKKNDNTFRIDEVKGMPISLYLEEIDEDIEDKDEDVKSLVPLKYYSDEKDSISESEIASESINKVSEINELPHIIITDRDKEEHK